MDDLVQLGCKKVCYLPFGYDPTLFYPKPGKPSETACDLFFAGGADADRVPLMSGVIRANFRLKLYGDYWGNLLGTY